MCAAVAFRQCNPDASIPPTRLTLLAQILHLTGQGKTPPLHIDSRHPPRPTIGAMSPIPPASHSPSRISQPQAPSQETITAATSITPGRRATALQTIYHEALAHTVKTISYESFASCFPTPARYCPNSLRAVWKQMMGRFEELAKVGCICLVDVCAWFDNRLWNSLLGGRRV